MNTSQAEKKVYAFHTVFRVDVNDVKNPTETSSFDHFLDPQSIPRLLKQKKTMTDSNFAFILFQQFTTGLRLVTHIPK